MKRFLLLVFALVCLVGVLGGCTMNERTADERFRRYARITDTNMHMFWEDWDYLWLYDKESKLSKWHTKVRN
ncbi:MAG: hypothetical protein ACLFVW_05600 [Phycisphaerae bacterium]